MNSAIVSNDLDLLETGFRTGALQMTHFQKVPAAVWQSQIQQQAQSPYEVHSTGHKNNALPSPSRLPRGMSTFSPGPNNLTQHPPQPRHDAAEATRHLFDSYSLVIQNRTRLSSGIPAPAIGTMEPLCGLCAVRRDAVRTRLP